MNGHSISRALRRLAGRRPPSMWRVGPWPDGVPAGGDEHRLVLLDGGPVELVLDGALLTVSDGAVLRLSGDMVERTTVMLHEQEPVWLWLGAPEPESEPRP